MKRRKIMMAVLLAGVVTLILAGFWHDALLAQFCGCEAEAAYGGSAITSYAQ